MWGGSAEVGLINVAWPTAEFAGMNIEGAVKLGFRDVLMAIDDPEARRDEFDTRRWIANGLRGLPPPPKRDGKKYRFIDTW